MVPHSGERCQRGFVHDSPTVKRLEHVSKKNESIPTGASA